MKRIVLVFLLLVLLASSAYAFSFLDIFKINKEVSIEINQVQRTNNQLNTLIQNNNNINIPKLKFILYSDEGSDIVYSSKSLNSYSSSWFLQTFNSNLKTFQKIEVTPVNNYLRAIGSSEIYYFTGSEESITSTKETTVKSTSLEITTTLATPCQPSSGTVYNNLNELFCRKERYTTNPKPTSLNNDQIMQPELVIYKDTQYNTEVWKITNDNTKASSDTQHHCHINRSPWNKDGSKIVLRTNRIFPSLDCGGDVDCMVIMDGDGDNLRRLNPSVSGLILYSEFVIWDRFNKDIAYFVNSGSNLYKVDVSNNDLAQVLKTFPSQFSSRRKTIFSYNSESNKIMIKENNIGVGVYPNIYMVDPTDTNPSLWPSGNSMYYPINFGLSASCHSQSEEWHIHDIYFRRTSDNSYIFNYGPQGDVGEYCFFERSYNGQSGELFYPDTANGIPYYSHPAWNKDGSLVAYGGESSPGANDWGLHLRRHDTNQYLCQLATNSQANGVHYAWDGYDDTWIFAGISLGSWGGKIVKLKTDCSHSQDGPFVNPYTKINGGTYTYCASPRPAQSPDATKVLYTSTMLKNTDTVTDVYVAVAQKPYPPQTVTGSFSPSPVTLNWNTPTNSRETKGYHVYRTTDLTLNSGWTEISSSIVIGTSFTDATASSGTYYYGITSEEYSGLESDSLSNIVKVTIGGSINNNYASGKTGFDTTAPSSVTGVSLQKLADGQYKIQWSSVTNKDLRYYNIYYSSSGVAPDKTQQFLIASPPKTETSYVDWLAKKGVTNAIYGISAVDRQGNEGQIMHIYEAPQSCWDNDFDGYEDITCGGTDCNDVNNAIYPGATEVCNNLDDDCDTIIDEGFDIDSDTYTTCALPIADCNDNNRYVYPGAPEVCDGIDNQCPGDTGYGQIDENNVCPTCPQGQITQRCNCGGSIYTSGYCCNNIYKTSPCSPVYACGTPGKICIISSNCIGSCSQDGQVCNDIANDNCPDSCNIDLITSTTPVTTDNEGWLPAINIVDGSKDQVSDYWAGQKPAPHWVRIDLGLDKQFNKLDIAPFGRGSTNYYYYNGAWKVEYATNSAPNTWLDFSNVIKTSGSGTLTLPGIYMSSTDPGHHNSDINYKFYSFTFDQVNAGYIRYTVTIGDSDGDTNGDEIEAYYCVPEPSIYSISQEAKETYASIKWLSNKVSDTKVIYGTDPSNLNLEQYNPTYVVEHKIKLQNLEPDTTYFYKLISCNNDNCKESNLMTFSTSKYWIYKFIEFVSKLFT